MAHCRIFGSGGYSFKAKKSVEWHKEIGTTPSSRKEAAMGNKDRKKETKKPKKTATKK
jgi:hypothetical protein